MLEITIPETEFIDPKTNSFINTKETILQLEHSLLSISKWESRHKKPFLGDGTVEGRLTPLEFLDYIKDMTLTRNVDPNVYDRIRIDRDILERINTYLEDPMTATTFSNASPTNANSKQIVTAEIIYWEMIQLNIPFECQKWHLNRLMTLIRVCSIKQQKPEKMPYKDMVAQRKALNAQRKARHRR